MECVPVDPKTISSICDVIENILVKSYGPKPSQTMLNSSTGKMLLTSDGVTILESLHLSHPIARVIVKSVATYHGKTGDGSKIFILMLSGFMRKMMSSSSRLCHELPKNLSYICAKFQTLLQHEIIPIFLNYANSIPSDVTEQNFWSICRNISRTSMQGKCPDLVSDKLTDLLNEFLKQSVPSVQDLISHIHEFAHNFSTVCHKIQGAYPYASKVVDGIIISRDFTVDCGLLSTDIDIQLLCLKCPFGDISGNFNEVVTVDTKGTTGLLNIFNWQNEVIRNILQSYQTLGINLILCSDGVSDVAKHLCREFQISVISFMPEEELKLMSDIAGTSCVGCWAELVSAQDIACAAKCRSLVINGRKCIQLTGLKTTGIISPKQILLCGPTESICTVYELILMNALQCIQVWLDRNNFEHRTLSHGAFLPAGGTPEILLYELLEKYSTKCQDVDLASFCKMLGHAYLTVPSCLYKNAFRTNSGSLLLEARSNFSRNLEYCALPITQTFLPNNQDYIPMESVMSKVILLYSIMELLQQLLRLDSILPVKKR